MEDSIERDDQGQSQQGSGYISARDSRRITRENRRATNALEKRYKRKNVPESEYITQMRDPANIVEFDNLHTYFFTDIGTVKAVNGVTFDVPQGGTVGVVGESGCGKSVTSLSLMQLLQRPQGQITSGSIRLNCGADAGFKTRDDVRGRAIDAANAPQYVMEAVRGKVVSMIFQEPMTSLNPVMRIGDQIDEVTAQHQPGTDKAAMKRRSLEMIEMVGIANGERVYKMYPHELSGGMRQRAMIAMALACDPRLIIADEPTTALDVTIQAQILDLLRGLKDRLSSAIMLITHDLGVIAEMADFVVVMYAGKVVEKGTTKDVFLNPAHPYTMGLMASKPVIGREVDRLYSIPGSVPNPINMPDYCYFRDRCPNSRKECLGLYPPEIALNATHFAACYRAKEGAKA
ncbi:MAG: ABC transporter ATP-binding protein [Oscillospiraceae bacterium]|jgi:peptide/nickel transport system ATP-binding protein|nr:ABC transporter ATP-binding protein [Oscillospiraceae bacterium]